MACSNFPDCRNTKAIVKSIGVKCPKCNDGDVVERKSKRIVSFMDVRNILNATLSLGISRLEEIVQNVTNILLKIKGKTTQVICSNCDYKEAAQK